MKRHRISRRTKRMLAIAFADTLMKFAGVSMFLIGLGALAEIPTDPKTILQSLALFAGGVGLIAWNGYIVEHRKGEYR